MTAANVARRDAWRAKVRARGDYYSIRAHMAQLEQGIDWTRRDSDGMLRMGPDGHLPRNGQ